MAIVCCAASSVCMSKTPPPLAAHWPQWRGPKMTGEAVLGDSPVEWSEKKNVRWKVTLPGTGHSTPVVWGERVFVTTAVPTEKDADPKKLREMEEKLPQWRRRSSKSAKKVQRFVVLCINLKDGAILWQKVVREAPPHESIHKEGSWASNSPVTDGEHVWAFFGSNGLYCFDMKGELKWEKDFGNMTMKMSFGEGISPALYGDTLVINWDHEGDSFIVALDKKTGTELWKKSRDEVSSWSTPVVVEHEGKPQIIVSAYKRVRGYDLATGDELWECGGLTANVTPVPVYANGIVYVMSGFRGAALRAIRLDKAKGDITDSVDAIAWKLAANTPYAPSPFLYDGYL